MSEKRAGRELERERVAEVAEHVMGWAVNRSERGWHTIGVSPKRLIGPSKCRLPGDCWDPLTRIDHAWEVVEKVSAEHDVEVYRHHDIPLFATRWVCKVGELVDHDPCWIAEADTAPLAICLASLQAVGAPTP